MRAVRTRWVLLAAGVVVLAAGVVVAGPARRTAHRLFENVVMDNVPSGVACPDLPPRHVVEQVLVDRSGLVARITAVGSPGEVDVLIDTPCNSDDHAEILIVYPGHAQRQRIEAILRTDPFPVPVTLRDV